jgi:hypothetical protein
MKTWVELGNKKKYSLDWAEQQETSWQGILRANHGSPAHCCCSETRLRLSVRHREVTASGRVESRYHLAVYPGTGSRHSVRCQFHRVLPYRTGASAYAPGVLIERDDGTVQIRLSPPLVGEPNEGGAIHGPQRSMSPLGLLHLLWERADLNNWQGGKGRGWRWVADALRDVSEDVTVSAHRAASVPLRDHLIVLQPEKDEIRRRTYDSLNRGMLERILNSQHRAVLIGELKKYRVNNGDANLFFHGTKGVKLDIWLAREAEFFRRFPTPAMLLSAPEEGASRARCICIAIVDIRMLRNGTVRADVRGGALMSVNRAFLPYASSYERRVADKLVDEERKLRKPLRYDAGDIVLPDFELLDADAPIVPMEVFGIDTDDYRRRMAQKQAFYDQHYGPGLWWHWIAAGRDRQSTPPPFPQASSKNY